MDSKELDQLVNSEAAPSDDAGQYLQEAGDTVTQMVNKFKMSVQQQAVSELKPSELAKINAKMKFDFLSREIGAMVSRGDVGETVIDAKTGQVVEKDMDFLADKKRIPEDLRKEMEAK